MAKIKTLKQGNEQIIPRTLAEAVSTSNDSTVQIELDNLNRKVEEVPDVSAQINEHNISETAHENRFSQYLPLTGGEIEGTLDLIGTNYSITFKQNKEDERDATLNYSLRYVNSSENSTFTIESRRISGPVLSFDTNSGQIRALTQMQTGYSLDYTPTKNNSITTKKYVDDQIKAIPTPDVSAQISAHNTAEDAHANKHWLTSSDEELSEILPGEPIDADTLQGRPASYFATKDDLEGITVDVDLSNYVTNDALSLQLQNYALKTEVQTLTEQLSALTTRVTNIENEINGVAAKIDEINGEVI